MPISKKSRQSFCRIKKLSYFKSELDTHGPVGFVQKSLCFCRHLFLKIDCSARIILKSFRLLTFHVEADENAVFLVHVWHVSLGKVVDVRVFGLAPVIAPHVRKARFLQTAGERGKIEHVVVDVVEVVLPAEERADHQVETLKAPVDLADLGEIGH